MSSIRKEYVESKQQASQALIYEELEADGDLVLITERLNRSTVNKLNNSIKRFDEKFSPYNEKLPAIAEIIKSAEEGLYLVLTGKMGSRNAGKMLERMSVIHNILTDFFGRDLAMLISMPYFKAARLTPDIRLDELAVDDHSVKVIRKTFAAALKPSKDERQLFRKVFRNFEMPSLDWNEAAKQLVSLTYNELVDLSDIERIPMLIADLKDKQEEPVDESSQLDESGLTERGGGNIGSKLMGAAGTFGTKAGKGIAGVGGAAVAGTALASVALYNRFKGPSVEDIKQMNIYFNKIEAVIPKNLPQTKGMIDGLNTLEANIAKAEGGAKFAGWNPLRNPAQRAMAQGKQVVDMFEKLGAIWLSSGKKYNKDGKIDIVGLRKLFNSNVNGVGAKAGRLFKATLPKGLDAKSVVEALIAIANAPSDDQSDKKDETKPDTGEAEEGKPTAPVQLPEHIETIYENRLDIFFNSIPKKKSLSESLLYQFSILEEFEAYAEHSGILLMEDWAMLDDMLKKFSQIKTTADERMEIAATAAEKGAAPAQVIPKRPIEKIEAVHVDTAIANASNKKYSPDEVKAITAKIAELKIPEVTDMVSAAYYLNTYKQWFKEFDKLKQLEAILDSNPSGLPLAEIRNAKLKRQ